MSPKSRLVLLIMVGGLLAGCSDNRNATRTLSVPVAPVVKAARRNLANHLEIAAEFRPYQEVDVYAKVSGYIRKLYINWGTHVKKGDLLAKLDNPELEHQLQRDQATIRRSEHEVTRWREDLNRSKSAYTVSHLTYARLAEVQEKRPELIAQQEIDVAKGKYEEASANVSAATASLQAAQEALLDSEAALKQDQALYAYTRMTAPFDGVITRIDAYSGALLPAATSSDREASPLCHLSQNNLLRLVIPLPQRVLSEVHVGQVIDVKLGNPDRTFKGQIVLFTDQVDLTTRTMHTEVTVPNPAYELVPGTYASVEIPVQGAENVVALPIQAVLAMAEGDGTVLVVNGSNRIEQRRVTLGVQTANEIEIKSGVHEGELVVFGNQGQYIQLAILGCPTTSWIKAKVPKKTENKIPRANHEVFQALENGGIVR